KEICDSRDVWSDAFQQFKPLIGYRGLEIRETGEIAPWSRQALNHASVDRVAYLHKYRRRRAGGISDRERDGRRVGEDHVRPQIEQFWLTGALALHRRHSSDR